MNDFSMDIISIHCNNDRMQAARVYQYVMINSKNFLCQKLQRFLLDGI